MTLEGFLRAVERLGAEALGLETDAPAEFLELARRLRAEARLRLRPLDLEQHAPALTERFSWLEVDE